MIIKNKKTLLIVLVALLFVCSISVLCATAFASNVTISEVNFKDGYCVGETLEIPSATISDGNTSVEANIVVTYPSGLTYSRNKISLSESGVYTVRYLAKINGSVKYFDKTFSVKNYTYYVTSKVSSAEYNSEYGGIELNLANGSYFVYNRVIDLSDNTRDDTLFEFFVIASKTGEPDFGKFYFILTDCEDPDNFITLRMHSDAVEIVSNRTKYEMVNYTSYAGATIGKSNSYVGLQDFVDHTTLHKGDRYGRAVRFSFTNSAYNDLSPEEDRGVFCIDYDTLAFYAYSTTDPAYSLSRTEGIVCDFDDLTYFDNPWSGFKTGKCKLSIYAANYYNDNANIVLTKIDDHDLSEEYITDNVPPVIKINYSGYENDIPKGIIGKTYPIFDYDAFDDYGVKDSKVEVYFNYYAENRVSVNVKNGSFVPSKTGTYHIVYSAVDKNGNVAESVVPVAVGTESKPISIDAGVFGVAYAGKKFTFPKVSTDSDAEYGIVDVSIVAKCKDITEDVSLTRQFIPMYIGEWTIEYTATNFSGQKTVVEKKLNVQNNDKPVFVETDFNNLEFPKYFMHGLEYTIPSLNAYEFDEKSYYARQAKTLYSSDGVNYKELTGEFTADAFNNGDTVYFKYRYEGVESDVIKIPIIKAKVNGAVTPTNLFSVKSGNVSSSATEDYVVFSSDSDFSVQFVNEVIVEDLQFDVKLIDSDFKKFNVTLSDACDPSLSVKFSFVIQKTDGNVKLFYQDNEISGATNNTITLKINSKNIKISAAETYTYPILTDLNGNKFDGFSSPFVYLDFGLDGISSLQKIGVSKIANQPLNNMGSEDVMEPVLYLYKEAGVYQQLNSMLIIGKATSADVYDGVVQTFVSVTKNGKYLTSVDGVVLDNVFADREYQIKLSDFGEYQVEYATEDSSNNSKNLTKTVKVLDNVAPVITVSGNIPTAVKLSDKFVVPKATCEDNISIGLTVRVLTISPYNVYTLINVENGKDTAISFDVKGTWKLRYFVYDEVGNVGIKDYAIDVK